MLPRLYGEGMPTPKPQDRPSSPRARGARPLGWLLTVLLAGCQAGVGAASGPSGIPGHLSEPGYRLNARELPAGATVPDWVDVVQAGVTPAWVYSGNWAIDQRPDGTPAWIHSDLRDGAGVSFRRYAGTALGGADGAMPARYMAEAEVTVIRATGYYAPTGDQGQPFYYLDPQHYVEVVLKPGAIEVWEVDGGQPKTTQGWKKLWSQALKTAALEPRLVGAEVDTLAGSFTPLLDGKALVGPLKSALIRADRPVRVAMRAIGNVVAFDRLRIEPR